MPRFQDPALHTPEKIRAASSLWRLGGGLLLFTVLFFTFVICVDKPWRWNQVLIGELIVFAVIFGLPAIGGILAIMAGIGICQGRCWKGIVCRLAFGISSAYLGTFLIIFAVVSLSRQMGMLDYTFVIPLVGCAFLLGAAMVRCIQFARAEQRRASPCSGLLRGQ